jgi:hypothetical protein
MKIPYSATASLPGNCSPLYICEQPKRNGEDGNIGSLVSRTRDLLEIHPELAVPAELLSHLSQIQLIDLVRVHMKVDGQQKDEPLTGTL